MPPSEHEKRSGPWSLATADLADVPACVLDDEARLRAALERPLSACIGVIAWQTHRYAPRGLSLVGTALGGRVIVHTWPELARLTIDLYGSHEDVGPALDAGVKGLGRAPE